MGPCCGCTGLGLEPHAPCPTLNMGTDARSSAFLWVRAGLTAAPSDPEAAGRRAGAPLEQKCC